MALHVFQSAQESFIPPQIYTSAETNSKFTIRVVVAIMIDYLIILSGMCCHYNCIKSAHNIIICFADRLDASLTLKLIHSLHIVITMLDS